MALFASTTLFSIIAFSILFSYTSCSISCITDSEDQSSIPTSDVDLLEFPLNLEYLEAEFFLCGAMGQGLDKYAPNLTSGGPSPIGAQQANLDPVIRDVIEQFGWQEVGHLRAIKNTVKGFPRPLLDLSVSSFAKTIDKALGIQLEPPFNPYANGLNFLIASYIIPYVGLTGYVGANPQLEAPASKKLVAGLLAVESGQDAVIRGLLYERKSEIVDPYGIPVDRFTALISQLRDKLGGEGMKDGGLIGPKKYSAEGKTEGNILVGDEDSLGYGRTPQEILRIVYGSGDEHTPGGFYPKGGDGTIAKSYLNSTK